VPFFLPLDPSDDRSNIASIHGKEEKRLHTIGSGNTHENFENAPISEGTTYYIYLSKGEATIERTQDDRQEYDNIGGDISQKVPLIYDMEWWEESVVPPVGI
jgi:hypothetical protein